MQTSTLGWRDRSRESGSGQWNGKRQSFFGAHPIGEIIRGLVFSSVLWGLLAAGVYTVYAMVLGTR
jgi:hypothetical protein